MKCYGLHRGFSQFGISIFNMHDVWTPPAPVIKFVPGFMEGPAFMGHPPGIPLTHKVSRKVHFDGGPAIQQGHDAGYLIPHIPPIAAIPNVMLLIHMAVSKHKVMFPATRVLLEGKPMGMYFGLFLGSICSNPVSLPTGFLIKLSGTVVHQMSLADFILGLAMMLVDVVLDVLWSKVMKGDIWRGANTRLTSAAIRKASVAWRASGKLQDRVPALRSLAQKWAGNTATKNKTWWKGRLEMMFTDTMARDTDGLPRKLGLVGRHVWSKWVDHFAKSWVVSPLTSGLVFQGAAKVTGIPSTSVPSIALGRAGLHLSFFLKGKPVSVHQNVNN